MRNEATTIAGSAIEVEMTTKIDSRFGKTMDVLMTIEEVVFLDSLVVDRKPVVAVEIGSWEGGSAVILAKHSERVFCVDTWEDYTDIGGFDVTRVITYHQGRERFRKFCENIGDDLFKRVFPCRGESTTWARIWNQPIDLLFIDGCHSYEAVKADIEGWYPHVRAGGVILGHDYLRMSKGDGDFIWEFPGVARAVHESFKDFYVIPGTTFWMVIKGGTGDARSGIGGLEGGGEMDGEIQKSAHEGWS